MSNASQFIKLVGIAEDSLGRVSLAVERARDIAKDEANPMRPGRDAVGVVAARNVATLERLIEKLESVAEELSDLYADAEAAREEMSND